ncbi:MAG: phosphatase PAP2 family protein [Bacteroidota bacterium]|nr:phosphatase PAP2 family protein [Bacteroidota bacterium]
MVEFLYSIDKAIFYFCNQTLSNSVFDVLMPAITDWNKSWIGIGFFGLFWIFLFWKGGKRGRTAALLLIPLILLSDQVSSNILKNIFVRPRPCHILDGVMVVENIRLLVSCGPGFSFPSSHAANNFAFAFLMSFFYRKWTWVFIFYASIMGFSRISVGVHYPSDVLGGAALGAVYAFLIISIWKIAAIKFPSLALEQR